MIAGLASQVASLFAFVLLCADFAWRVKKNGENSYFRSHEALRKIGTSVTRLEVLVYGMSADFCCSINFSLFSFRSNADELRRLSYCNLGHLHPVLLPYCRAARWVWRKVGEPASFIYDSRRRHDCHFSVGVDCSSSWFCFQAVLEDAAGKRESRMRVIWVIDIR